MSSRRPEFSRNGVDPLLREFRWAKVRAALLGQINGLELLESSFFGMEIRGQF